MLNHNYANIVCVCVTVCLFVSSMLQAGKYNHGKFAADGTTHSIPTPLAHAFEQLMLGRQMLGEENDIIFARNLLDDLIKVWNDNIKQLRADFTKSMGGKALSSIDKQHDGQSDGAQQHVSSGTMDALNETLDEMKTIVIAQTPGALKFLGVDVSIAVFLRVYIYRCTSIHSQPAMLANYSRRIYIYIYIYTYIYIYIYIYIYTHMLQSCLSCMHCFACQHRWQTSHICIYKYIYI